MSLAPSLASLLGVLFTLFIANNGWASSSSISFAQAVEMAKQVDSGFSVSVNADVVRQLNKLIGTPAARRRMNTILERMKTFAPQMEAAFEFHSAPEELYAIPIVESAYQNLRQKSKKGTGAGLWQLMGATARTHKLRVDKSVDERLDIEKQTHAALKLLTTDRERLGDWSLAVLAYNVGAKNVLQAMKRTGSRDPWVLIRSGLKADPRYLAKVTAAVLVLSNPDSI